MNMVRCKEYGNKQYKGIYIIMLNEGSVLFPCEGDGETPESGAFKSSF